MVQPDRPQIEIFWGAGALHAGYLRLHTYTHTLRICTTYCFPTATMVMRTRLDVEIHVHCVPCYIFSYRCKQEGLFTNRVVLRGRKSTSGFKFHLYGFRAVW